jgi:hypothetical protein
MTLQIYQKQFGEQLGSEIPAEERNDNWRFVGCHLDVKISDISVGVRWWKDLGVFGLVAALPFFGLRFTWFNERVNFE